MNRKKTIIILMSMLGIIVLLSCKLPSIPILNRATETSTPTKPTFLPTEPETITSEIENTPTTQPTATATPDSTQGGAMGEGGGTQNTPESRDPTESDLPGSEEYTFNPEELDPPLEEWKGLPIMPGAIGGSESEGGYGYFIEASLEEVDLFYEQFLTEAGYSVFTSIDDNPNLIFVMYFDGSDFIGLSAILPEGETYTMVILANE